MNITGFISALLALLVFAAAYRNLKPKQPETRCVYFFGFLVLSLPSLLFTIHYAHILPEWEWFYSMRAWRGSEFLILFLGASMGAASAILPKLLRFLPLVFVCLFTAVPYIKPLAAPLKDSQFQDLWKNDVCLQSTPSTCGPASICNILKTLGTNVSEKDVARAAFTYAGGTEAWYLARYVRSKGFSARFDFRPSFSPEAGFPAVLGVRFGGTGHFIAILDITDNVVTFVDPMLGQGKLPLDEFHKRYTFSGFHLVIHKA